MGSTKKAAYQLTLTKAERRAIDWVGDRYPHGTGLYRALYVDCVRDTDQGWDADVDITFHVPEAAARRIANMGVGGWACFDEGLVSKLNEFVSQIP